MSTDKEASPPAVTVILPLHNHAQWIGGAISSVVDQDYPNKRIIVVDDGSTDNSAEAVMDLLDGTKTPSNQGEPKVCHGTVRGSDTGLMLCRFQEARGPSFARNWGLKVGWDGADVFTFLDSDDEYLAGKISKSVAKWLEAPESIGVIFSDYDTLNNSGLRLRQYKEPYSRQRLFQECLANADSLISKAAFEKCGFFDENLRVAEDYDFWLRAAEHFILVHIPESLLTIRVGEHSSSSQVPSEIWQQNYGRVMQKAQERARGQA